MPIRLRPTHTSFCSYANYPLYSHNGPCYTLVIETGLARLGTGGTPMNATSKQVSYIRFLASKLGFRDDVTAVDDYGFGIRSVSSLTIREASELIDWLKSNPAPRARDAA